jgi:hypothetical protein
MVLGGGGVGEIESNKIEMINLQKLWIKNITIFMKDIIKIIITYYSHTPKLLIAIGPVK